VRAECLEEFAGVESSLGCGQFGWNLELIELEEGTPETEAETELVGCADGLLERVKEGAHCWAIVGEWGQEGEAVGVFLQEHVVHS